MRSFRRLVEWVVLKKEKVGLIRRESIRETGLNKGNSIGGIMVLLPEP